MDLFVDVDTFDGEADLARVEESKSSNLEVSVGTDPVLE